MRCKDCCNFKTDVNMESAEELSPNTKMSRGRCNINNKGCNALDSCECGAFRKK